MSACVRTERIHLFVDGELSEAEAEEVRVHLADCADCQAELDTVMQLDVLGDTLLDKKEQQAPAPKVLDFAAEKARRRPRRIAWISAASGLAAAAAIVLFVRPGNEADLYNLGQARPFEARLTHAGAAEYRPYEIVRAAGPHGVEVSLETMAKLEKAGDKQGVATAYLLRGEKVAAAETFAKAKESPEVDSDRAALSLMSGDAEGALALVEGVLRAAPTHPQALWNRGLALRDLGLTLSAAEAFEEVAKRNEPGWAQEAKARAEQLRKQAAERTEAWKKADAAGLAWVMTGAAPSEAEVRRFPGLFRLNLYDAVRAAPDAARVNAVRPLAALLDSIYGGHVLSDYVEQVSKADFKVRAPLAAEYAKMRAGTLSWPEQGALFGKTKDAGQADLRMGTLFFTYQIPANLPEYKHLVEQSRDPWFAALAALNEARGVAGKNPLEAEQLLRQALIDAHAAKLDYRAVQLELALADVLASMQRVPEAFAASLRAFKLARSDGEIELEAQAISRLIAAARLRWAFALVRAYAHEATLAKPADCDTQQYAHLNAANAAALELRSAEARAEFDQVKACDGRPLGLHEAGVLADLARLDNHPGDTQRVLEIIKTLRDQNALSPGDKAEADDIAGRALLEQSEAEGKKLLEQSIAAADALGPQDVQGQKARAYSYVSLQLDAARKGRFDEALALLAKEQHVEQPRECALGVGVDDDRSYVIAAGADGKLVGSFEARRAESIETFVPHPNPLQLAALKGCAEVAVLARPPLQGRPGILPPEIAWAFGVKPAHATPSELPRTKRLVVADVEPPASLELPRLASWGRSNEARHDDQIELHGAMATPSRVLQEMEKATEIEIHAHGFVDLAVSDASLLALSPDADGSWALSASQVRSHKLLGHPLVVLGACRAAVGAPQLHAPWSLPAAFREAGASAVLASRADIPDAQARAFFDAVLAGIRSGKPQAVALRDARMEFRSKPQGSWVDSVLLFQ